MNYVHNMALLKKSKMDNSASWIILFLNKIYSLFILSITINLISILLNTGAMMEVNIANDGPVTIELESKNDNIDHSNS